MTSVASVNFPFANLTWIFLLFVIQSWEKTVDCHSPGQGLMPASFKVRNVPLDGKNGEFEDVLDPDFGESAIGRVAPVDSGKPRPHLISMHCQLIYI